MTNVDIGKLYGVCRRFIDLWENVYSDPKEFEPLVEELREAVGIQQELDRYEDLRVNLAQRAFTAPDASDEEMLASLDARIRDAVAAPQPDEGTHTKEDHDRSVGYYGACFYCDTGDRLLEEGR